MPVCQLFVLVIMCCKCHPGRCVSDSLLAFGSSLWNPRGREGASTVDQLRVGGPGAVGLPEADGGSTWGALLHGVLRASMEVWAGAGRAAERGQLFVCLFVCLFLFVRSFICSN